MTSVEYDQINEYSQAPIRDNPLQLTTDAYRDYITTSVVAFSDSWMQYDLMGRAQPDLYSVNRPRLAAVLNAISEVLNSETDPGDPTHFGIPTDSGIENYFNSDGNPSNVWEQYKS
ncbi:hypothetical protein AB0L82_43450 [Nocardia sp. NPDC052001]|uniref:hypothetical protein n=1 Tax=Nocardia sp. NPDC052001 TaxID=3154853 RepID=UPI003442620C